MLPKLVALILIAGATACGLLVIRQHRIDAAHQMSAIHQRLLQHEQRLWKLRVAIHERLRQDQVALMAENLAAEQDVALSPILLEECIVRLQDAAADASEGER